VLLRPPGAVASSGPDAAELAAACGLYVDPWQAEALDVSMAERADGSWAAGEVGIIASRQNGKNGVVEIRELFGLTVLNEWIIHTAHLFKTTRESYDRLLGLIEANPDVASCMVSHVASPASGYEMRFRGGGRISFIARSRTSGRGLTGDLLVFDEAQDLTDEALGALMPTISARPGSQAWYLGSAPDLNSVVFHRVRKRGRRGTDARLAYLEYSADPDDDLDDRDVWARANPAYGTRITEEAVERDRASMSDELFARERLSVSPDIEDAAQIIPPDDWAACFDPKSGPVGPVSYAIDVNPSRTHGSLAVAAASGRGGTHLEMIDYKPGTDWIPARAKELQSKWGGKFAIAAGSPAAALLLELEGLGVEVLVVSTSEHAQACGAFYDGVVQHKVRYLHHRALDSAVAGADRKFYGDSWLWFRRTEIDISPLVAVTLAKWAADQIPDLVGLPEIR